MMATSSEEVINWKKYHFQEYLHYFLSLIQGSTGSYKHGSNGAHLLYTGDDMWNSIMLFSMNNELSENLPDEMQNWLQFFYRHGADHADIYFPSDIEFRYKMALFHSLTTLISDCPLRARKLRGANVR
jgi:hypothetical protein